MKVLAWYVDRNGIENHNIIKHACLGGMNECGVSHSRDPNDTRSKLVPALPFLRKTINSLPWRFHNSTFLSMVVPYFANSFYSAHNAQIIFHATPSGIIISLCMCMFSSFCIGLVDTEEYILEANSDEKPFELTSYHGNTNVPTFFLSCSKQCIWVCAVRVWKKTIWKGTWSWVLSHLQ